ncbi:polysaccharide deacetylase family sporulation protein PdaB [Effusibacillus dendaii]|uniref:Polysaccharide deacetylase PdaB family n=1 Tax=Effusibacillus dendaii TaxID=2743772 RepID=A0A7I8DEM2_9BACL|nr:polysaccharide deacetylase family sporulation protein PdaB [Effusibacillus dendaii]BCJ87296.1 polysaccharide deacetylase PdaB family [Effusibacillus dendaii]
MNIIWSFQWKQGKRVAILAIAMLLFVGVLYSEAGFGKIGALPTITPSSPGAIYKVDTDQKVVALTFDISWGEKTPGPVLDVLDKKGLTKATFFLSGPWTATHTDIAKRIKSMGFEIGSHGNLHKNFSEYSNEWIDDQVKKAEASIYDVTGVKTKLIRTPNGDFNKRVLEKLHSMGYTTIQWDTDSLDWKNPGVDAIVNRVLSKAHPGDIILMHASDSCKQTVEALPRIIDGLRAKGYQFVTVSELIAGTNAKSKTE